MEERGAPRKRYIIWATGITRSAGTKALYQLYGLLRRKGCASFMYCPEEHLDGYEYLDLLDAETLRNDIVGYPEIVYGNPLRFRNVARFVLYFPGVLAGEKEYHPGELVFTWSTDYGPGQWFAWNTIDLTLFRDEGLPKTQDCCFINKHGRWRDVPEARNTVEINMDFPETREELANLLKTTRVLYSFERYSVLNDEATLCGARVKIVTEEGLEDYTPWGIVSEAKADALLDEFISATQQMNYVGPLQEEEKFWHYFAGMFYKAAARCASLGAWEEALSWCRKAWLGQPSEKPALALTPETPETVPGESPSSAGSPEFNEEKAATEKFFNMAREERFEEAEDTAMKRIAHAVRHGNRLTASAWLTSLALFYGHVGNMADAAEAEDFALNANPLNPVAALLGAVRHLEAGSVNRVVFLASRLLCVALHPLNIPRAFPALSLLGRIMADHPDRLASIAEKMPSFITSASRELQQTAGKNAVDWLKALQNSSLGGKILTVKRRNCGTPSKN